MNQNKAISSLWQYCKPYKKQILGASVSIIIVSLSILAIGKELEHLVDLGFAGGTKPLLMSLTMLSVITIVLVLAMFGRFWYVKYLGEKVIADIRIATYNHMINMSPSFFDDLHSANIVSRFTADAAVLQGILSTSLPIAIRNTLLLFGSILMLITISIKLFIYTILVILIAVLLMAIFGKKIKKLSKESQHKVSHISTKVSETVNGISTIKAFIQEKKEQEKFQEVINEALRAAIKTEIVRALLASLAVAVTLNGIIFVLWIGGREIFSSLATKGQLSSFIFYAVISGTSVGSLIEKVSTIYQATGAMERLLELLSRKDNIEEMNRTVALPDDKSLKINDVKFYYNQQKIVLEDFSLNVERGETVALVGLSGSGKSTIIKLLMRFYDPQQGNIMLGGVDIKSVPLTQLRNVYALAAQDSMIFSATVLENIKYGKPESDYAEIVVAAEAAAALDFIENLPQKFDTYIGEKGVTLSSGQRQRIIIARALLKKPEILLIDEATSSLDADNERVIYKSITELMHEHITILITHRIPTAKLADRIVVINNGRVESIGNHDDLMIKNSTYAKLAKLQFQI